MRTFVMMLSVVVLLAPNPLRADETKAVDVAGPVLDRVAKMGLPEQQAWLDRLEQRAMRAARLALKPEDAAAQQDRLGSRLHQRLVTWQVLREVLEETNRREKEAIDLLARRYRSQIRDTFRTQPEISDQRQGAWTAVYRDWKAAGARFDEQERLIDWLEAAIRSAGPERIGAVPDTPKFEKPKSERPKVEELSPPAQLAEQPAEAVKPRAAAKREESARSQVVVKREEPAKPQVVVKREEPAKPQVVVKREWPARLQAAGTVQVNVEELEARIAGSNLGFRTLESELDDKGTWNAARLEPLAERLKILVLRHADLDLFRELVPKEKRSSVGRLEGPQSAISELGARIVEARKLASGEQFSGTDAERQAELARLDTLSRRLAELGRK
jgi:hypothetical protein